MKRHYARYAARGCPETSVNLEPAQIRASDAVPFVPGASDEPNDNGPGSGSRRQTSSDGPITLISADPTMRPGRTNPVSRQRRRPVTEEATSGSPQA